MKPILVLLAALWAAPVVAQTTATNPVTFGWNANPVEDAVTGYRLVADQTIHEVGLATTFTATFPEGAHIAAVIAVNASGVSQPSAPLTFVIAPQTSPQCAGHPLTIAVEDWSRTVAIGGQGRILFSLANPFPIVHVEARFGSQAIAQMDGADLRATPGIKFSVPRTPGTFPITVFVQDSAGCTSVTTSPRSVTVQ